MASCCISFSSFGQAKVLTLSPFLQFKKHLNQSCPNSEVVYGCSNGTLPGLFHYSLPQVLLHYLSKECRRDILEKVSDNAVYCGKVTGRLSFSLSKIRLGKCSTFGLEANVPKVHLEKTGEALVQSHNTWRSSILLTPIYDLTLAATPPGVNGHK